MNIRAISCRLLFLCALAAPLVAGDLGIVRVRPGWRDAGSFKRISEYFSGKENTGGRVVLRSRPDERAGYYFHVRVANRGVPVAARIVLTVIAPTSAKPRPYSFDTDLAAGDTQLELGLTGVDWPDPKANPVAWKLEFLAADGHSLGVEQSFLWEQPSVQ